MTQPARFPYIDIDPAHPGASRLPYVPLILANGQTSVALSGLLDTGATVNVLPYGAGIQLGLIWTQQTTPIRLTGNLAQAEARCGALGPDRFLTSGPLGICLDIAHHCAADFRSSQLFP